jgi:cytochrome c oxidase cbb3-type subunit 3
VTGEKRVSWHGSFSTFVEVNMRPRTALATAAYLLMACIAVKLAAQGTPPQTPPAAPPGGAPQAPAGQPPGPGQGRGRGMGTFPAQQRPPADPEVVKKGGGLYGVYCRACHGTDLRGGDQGGPNLLRSQLVLNDQNGELILQVVQNGRQNPGMPVMPPLNIPEDDVRAIATFIHSVAATARGQGAPPEGPPVELNIVVGDAKAGQAFFNAKCGTCHSAGDMQGIATRVGDPMSLQNYWVSGGGGRGGRAGGPPTQTTVTVTEASGQKTEGRLVRIDDFAVVLTPADGLTRSFRRDGDVPKVEVKDPRQAHLKLLPTYTDKDIHDVTAYLVTLK